MNRVVLASFLLGGTVFSDTPLRFQKLTDNFYFLQSSTEAGNVGALVTEDGVLLTDTVEEGQVPAMIEALKRVTSKPVRWVVNTHSHGDHTGGNRYFLSRNIEVIGSLNLRRIMSEDRQEREGPDVREPSPGAPRLTFGRQLRLYPGGVEVRVLALDHKAHTGGDVVLFIPAEKVLLAGDIFMPGSFPEIDSGAEGTAPGWVDGMRQAIDWVPLVRPAIPPPKPPQAGKPVEEEKTLEELLIVIPGHGPASNLKEMKELLEAGQRLRAEASRAISAGRSRQSFLQSGAIAAFRNHKNFESFAGALYDALAKK